MRATHEDRENSREITEEGRIHLEHLLAVLHDRLQEAAVGLQRVIDPELTKGLRRGNLRRLRPVGLAGDFPEQRLQRELIIRLGLLPLVHLFVSETSAVIGEMKVRVDGVRLSESRQRSFVATA